MSVNVDKINVAPRRSTDARFSHRALQRRPLSKPWHSATFHTGCLVISLRAA